ncbi:low temperature requirement protein A [Micropruina sp.]|uniref:low temperature requirement protein A n=1 Tax=Micropruina sp. TaxID=2737536 RepID=UPI0039E5BF86
MTAQPNQQAPSRLGTLTAPLARMTGRDVHEAHRVATPLELLMDLAFVVAFGIAGEQFAHLIAEGHVVAGMGGFAFAMFGIVWAWINFSWFASAFDTDDWVYRLTTMVQMIGVVIFALGLPDMFHSMDAGEHLDTRVIIAGYVVMRVAMLAQWLRVALTEPAYRATAITYVITIAVAQAGWVVVAWLDLSLGASLAASAVLIVVEMLGPYLSETRQTGTPWHAHHIAERYGLLVIITLGEGVIGTVAAVGTAVGEAGWNFEAVAVVVAGIGLTFGLWWIYFATDFGGLLHARRNGSFGWGYGHLLLFPPLAAVGAGLHVAAYVLAHEAHIGMGTAVASVAGPVGAFMVVGYLLGTVLTHRLDAPHLGLVGAAVLVCVASVLLARSGLSMGGALLVTTLAPWVVVLGIELRGRSEASAGEALINTPTAG